MKLFLYATMVRATNDPLIFHNRSAKIESFTINRILSGLLTWESGDFKSMTLVSSEGSCAVTSHDAK